MHLPTFFEQFSIYFFKWARCTTIALKRVRTISLFCHSLYLLLGYSFKVAHEPFSLLEHIYPQLTIKPASLHSGIHSPEPHFPCLSLDPPLCKALFVPSQSAPLTSRTRIGGKKALGIQMLNSKLLLSVLASPGVRAPPSSGRTRGCWKQPYILFSALENKRFTPEAFHGNPEAPLQTT